MADSNSGPAEGIKGAVEGVKGKAKEVAGVVTGRDDLQEEGEALSEQLQALEEGLQGYGANVKAAAGAIVTIDRNGEAVIHRGLMREAEAKALRAGVRLETLETLLAQLRPQEGKPETPDRSTVSSRETPKA